MVLKMTEMTTKQSLAQLRYAKHRRDGDEDEDGRDHVVKREHRRFQKQCNVTVELEDVSLCRRASNIRDGRWPGHLKREKKKTRMKGERRNCTMSKKRKLIS